jgi:hypothetical protein
LRLQSQPALLSNVLMARVDLAHRAKDDARAEKHLEALLKLHPSPSLERAAHLKLAALRSADVGAALWAYFGAQQDDLRLFFLQRGHARAPNDPSVNYLLGRRLEQLGAARYAVPHLTTALGKELPDSLRRETLRLQLQALYLMGDCAGVRDWAGRLPPLGAAFQQNAAEWVDRCTFEEKTYKSPLVPEEPFR